MMENETEFEPIDLASLKPRGVGLTKFMKTLQVDGKLWPLKGFRVQSVQSVANGLGITVSTRKVGSEHYVTRLK